MKPELAKKYEELLKKVEEHMTTIAGSQVAIHESFRMIKLYTNMVAEERDELKGRIVRMGIIMEGIRNEMRMLSMSANIETCTRLENHFRLWDNAIAGEGTSQHGTS